jgi:hypothetical protein
MPAILPLDENMIHVNCIYINHNKNNYLLNIPPILARIEGFIWPKREVIWENRELCMTPLPSLPPLPEMVRKEWCWDDGTIEYQKIVQPIIKAWVSQIIAVERPSIEIALRNYSKKKGMPLGLERNPYTYKQNDEGNARWMPSRLFLAEGPQGWVNNN